MSDVLIIFAHPHFQHSRVNRMMVEAARHVEGVAIHDLYEMYPDYQIDLKHEKEALGCAHTVILQHPFQWYSCPPLLKEWLDVVLHKGWAYGENGSALQGKKWMSVISTGGAEHAYDPKGHNRYRMEQLMVPFEQTAYLCKMDYMPPLIFHDALKAGRDNISAHAEHYAALLHRLAKPVVQEERMVANG